MVLMAKKRINPWAKRLKRLREQLGITQTELGDRLRVGQRAVARYEAERIPPPPVQVLIELLEQGKI